MSQIEIGPELELSPSGRFLARSGTHHAIGETAGQALDALNAILASDPATNSTTLVVIQPSFQPDSFFSAGQIRRMQELIAGSRRAEHLGEPFPPELKAELQQLIDEELAGAARRTAALFPRSAA